MGYSLEYRDFHDMVNLIEKNIHHFHDMDLIVGIPRSGMLPATIVSLLLNKPLQTLDSYISGHEPSGGERMTVRNGKERLLKEKKHVLIIDDSISTGSELNKTKKKLSSCDTEHEELFFLSIYTTEAKKNIVDYYFEIIETPRLFQWNILNNYVLSKSCVDMDGVLCFDPTDEENDDGERYLDFIRNAKPLFVPDFRLKNIVTSRLEKYRRETETWLTKHGIKFENLYMMQHNTAVERRRAGRHAEYKASHYIKLNSVLFLESDKNQARKIYNLTKKPVFCTNTMEFFPTHVNEIELVNVRLRTRLKFRIKKMFFFLSKVKNKILFKVQPIKA